LANAGRALQPSADEGKLARQAVRALSVVVARGATCATPLALLLLPLGVIRQARRIHAIHEALARPKPTRRARPALAHLPITASARDHLRATAESAAHLLSWLLANVGRAGHPDIWLAHQAAGALSMEIARGAACATPLALLLLRVMVIRRIYAIHEALSCPSPARRIRPASAHLSSSAGAINRLPVSAKVPAHLLASVMPTDHVRARRRCASQVAQARAVVVASGAPDAADLTLVPARQTLAGRTRWRHEMGRHAIQVTSAIAVENTREPIGAARFSLLLCRLVLNLLQENT